MKKYSGIGGQAVLEGIIMRNGANYSVAVRKPDGEIAVQVREYHSITEGHRWMALPVIRGVFRFIDSLIIGIGSLTFSASFYEEEDAAKKEKPEKKPGAARHFTPEQRERLTMIGTVLLSLVLALAIFMALPVALSGLLKKVTDSELLLNLAEGLIRIAIFIAYVALISLMKDIKRTYMYHGAEHKCINCVEGGLPLTVPNVRKSSKEHKRCGTSFLLFVMVISIFVFMFIRIENLPLRMLSRVLLVPLVAGLSFEFLMLAGRSENPVVNALSRPGLWLQGLTTREPDDSMIEVAIQAVESVFDWRAFEAELQAETGRETAAAEAAP